jgi:hypothetical protein
MRISRTACPCPDTNVSLTVRESADQWFNFRVKLDRLNADYLSRFVKLDSRSAFIPRGLGSMVPSSVHVLHEQRITFQSAKLADLHDG